MKRALSQRVLTVLAAALFQFMNGARAADVTWTGAVSTDFTVGGNWSNGTGPTTGDALYFDFGTANFSSGVSSNYNAIRLKTGMLYLSGGALRATAQSAWDSWVGSDNGTTGTVNQTSGTADINELELGRTAGATGFYHLSGGTLNIARGLNGYSLYLGGNKSGASAGKGTFTISGGSMITRVGVKLGDATLTGTGTFSVLGSDATQIGIGSSGTLDGTWEQNSGSTLRVGVGPKGLTKIFIDDDPATTNRTVATFARDSQLDVGYYAGGYGGGTWTVMEVESSPITNNGLAFAPGVDTNLWSFRIDNSGANGLLTVTAVGEPANQILLTVGNTKKQIMKYGLDYERLWYWYGPSANLNQVAQWSLVDCSVDYIRVAMNCEYELTEGVYDLTAYTDKIIPMMTAMKAANPNIKFFATPRPLNEASGYGSAAWQPYPYWITGDPGDGSSFNFSWQKCAEYLVRYLILMDSYGFTITYLDVSNEWQSYPTGGRLQPSDVLNIRNHLIANLPSGIAVPLIVAPSAWSFSQGASFINYCGSLNVAGGLDIASCHNTGKQGTPQDFATAAKALGKEVWDSEVHGWKGSTPTDEIPNSFQWFDRIRAGFTGLDSWLTIGTTAQGHCYILNNGTTVTRNVKYYVFRKLSTTSNYGRALDINQPSEFVSTAALIRENLLTVWVLNTNTLSRAIKINVGNRVISDSAVRQNRWNEFLALEGVGSTITAGSTTNISVTIEGNSLYCFEITLQPTGADFPFVQAENYSSMSGISVQACTDDGGGNMVNFPSAGSQVAFNVDVTRPATYDIGFRVSSAAANIKFELYDGTNRLATMDRIATGDAQNWTTLYQTVTLAGGPTTFKVKATGGGWSLNWLKCSPLFVPPPPANLALNQPASASNVHSTGYEADKAVDGSAGTRWATAVSTPWLEVAFATATTVNSSKILDYGNRTKSYEIQYFDGTWKTAFTGGDPADSGQVDSFPAVTSTQFRLQIISSTGNPSIWEFELYNDPYQAVTNPAPTIAASANSVAVSWQGVPGSTYSLQRSTNLVTEPFTTIESGVPVLEATNIAIMVRTDPAAFYRVILE